MRLYESKFVAWLKAAPPDEVVGESRDSCGCPIANFYFYASGGDEVSIFSRDFSTEYIIDRGYSRRPAPPWAQDFMLAVDEDGAVEVTARRALTLLEQIR